MRRQQRRLDELHKRIADLEQRIGDREQAIRNLEAKMAAPGFYENKQAVKDTTEHHQQLMWEVGDLINQWEALERQAAEEVSTV